MTVDEIKQKNHKKRHLEESQDLVVKKKHKKEKKHKKDKKDKKAKKDKKTKKDKTTNSADSKEEEVVTKQDSVEPVVSIPSTNESNYVQDEKLTALSQSDIDAFYKDNNVTIEDPVKANLRPVISFDYVKLDSRIQSIISKFPKPTPIQAVAWPYLLSGKDVVGVAETGSGKTFAFGVPAINLLISNGQPKPKRVQVLIISPTRELASQIYDNLITLTDKVNLEACCVYGGVPKDEQRMKLKKCHVVVATPGRLLDLIQEGSVDLSKVKYLVLDEADRMLETGFEEDIKSIIRETDAKKRQTLMFTATWPKEVRELASSFMRQPVKVSIGNRDELTANKRITQIVEVVKPRAKEKILLSLLKKYQSGAKKNEKVLIFALYKKEAARVERNLRYNGYNVSAIHGDLTQQQRTNALNEFKSGKTNLLLATDVAARGLDIPNVKTVINLTFPLTVEDYVHRIGRTGRAGQTGVAHTLFTEESKHLAGALVNVLNGANQPVPKDLIKFGTHTKRKEHGAYGAFYKDVDMTKKPKKITFD